MGEIETFAQRQKADYIYDTYFNPNSKHAIDFNLLDTLNSYGVINVNEFNILTEKFDQIGDKLFKEMNKFDKNNLAI